MGADCLLPVVDRPRTRPDGTPFTIDDKEYWLRERDGGIRRNESVAMPYPKMLYRGLRGENGKPTVERLIVQSSREHEDKAVVGWCDHASDALAAFERSAEAVEQAAAETAYAVQRMSERARAEYQRESAANPEHVTDIAPKRKPGRPAKVAVTE